MKIYIAARYPMKDQIVGVAELLESRGVEVVSDWHREKHAPDVKIQAIPMEELELLAEKDMEQIASCDVMLFFSEDPDTATVRGGRHVEFGVALALHKSIWTIGARENIFHYLPVVTRFDSFKDFESFFTYHFALQEV